MPRPLGVRIAGTGRAVPNKILDNQFFVDRLDTSHEWILERTGIKTRHVVGEGESSATLATIAARNALDNAGLKPTDLDMILVATITPEYTFPSTAAIVQREIGAGTIPAFDFEAACSGFMYGLIMSTMMLQAGVYRRILVIGAETMSTVTDYEDRATCILFGDAAAGAIFEATPDASGPALLHHRMHAQGEGANILTIPGGGSRHPTSRKTLDERMHLIKMQGREVYKLAVKRNYEMVCDTLKEAGVSPEELAMVIPHQSNLRIIESAREKLKIPKDRMYVNIDRYGNTSAASIPLCFDECRRDGRIKTGDLVLLVSFGAGFTWSSALLRL